MSSSAVMARGFPSVLPETAGSTMSPTTITVPLSSAIPIKSGSKRRIPSPPLAKGLYPASEHLVARSEAHDSDPNWRQHSFAIPALTSMRSRRCVSGISDKSTRNSAKARAFSARNASSLNQLLDRGPSNTTFLGHNFRVLASNFKPGAQMGALDVFFGERHRPSLGAFPNVSGPPP